MWHLFDLWRPECYLGSEQTEGFGAFDGLLGDGEEGFVCCYKMLDGRQLRQHPLQLVVDIVQLGAVGRPIYRSKDQLCDLPGGEHGAQLGDGGVDMGFLQAQTVGVVCHGFQLGEALRLHLPQASAGHKNAA